MRRAAAIALLLFVLLAFAGLLASVIFFGIYERQDVRVTKVEQLCVMWPAGRASLLFSSREPIVGDCRKLNSMYRGSQGLGYRRPKSGIFASFVYRSPADDADHRGRLMRERNDEERPIQINDEIRLYVSRLISDVYTDFSSSAWPEPDQSFTPNPAP